MATLYSQMGLTDRKSATILGAPQAYIAQIEAEAGAPKIVQSARGKKSDWIQVFAVEAKSMLSELTAALSHLAPGGALWLSYPKASARGFSGAPKRAQVLAAVSELGLIPSRSVSLNDQFTALCCTLPGSVPAESRTEEPAAEAEKRELPERTEKRAALPERAQDGSDCKAEPAQAAPAGLRVTAEGYPALFVDPNLTFDGLHLLLSSQIGAERVDGPYSFDEGGQPIDLPKWAHCSTARIHRNAQLTKVSAITGEMIYQFPLGGEMAKIPITIQKAE